MRHLVLGVILSASFGAGCSLLLSIDGLTGSGADASTSGADATSDGSTVSMDSAADATDAPNDAPNDADGGPRLLFSDEFVGSALSSQWVTNGGTWAVAGGEAQQQSTASNPYMVVPSFAGPSTYRIASKLRQTSGDPGGAVEIMFRVQGAPNYDRYLCSWFANQLTLRIAVMDPGFAVIREVVVSPPANFTSTTPVTLEATAQGTNLGCRVVEIPQATLSATDGRFASGSFGLKTYVMAGAWDFIRVYDY